MKEEWTRFFKAWAKSEDFKKRVQEAESVVKLAKERVMVLFSGGKDSTVVLHLVTKFFDDAVVFHFDYGAELMPRHVEAEVLENLQKIIREKAISIRIIRGNYGRSNTENARFYKHWWAAIEDTIKKYRVKTVVGSLRAEESIKRKRLVSSQATIRGVSNIFPLKNWSWKDVWAYIISNELPYPRVYDKYAELLGYDKARFTTFFDEELDWLGMENVDKFLMWRHHNIG